MARYADEKQYSNKNKRSNDQSNGKATNFVAFHPTVAERDAIKEGDMDLLILVDVLSRAISRGLTLKITTNQGNTAYCAVVSEAGRPFGEGTALSCFHADLFRLFQMVDYMLNVKWPGYPETPPTVGQLEFDW